MPIEKALLLKGLGVCAICAGGATVALKWGDISNALFSPAESKKKEIAWGGLECEEPTGQEGGECKLKTGEKIFIKKKTGSSHFQLTSLEGGKIKVYKVEKTEGDDGYSEGFKFLVEEGDIGTTENNKLEEFETYEIKKGTDSNEADLKDQYFLSQKTDSKTEIKKALGLPWDLPDSDPKEQTNITTDNLKDIKFSGKTTPATISEGSVTLTISKETDKTQYPLGYKFTFKNTVDTAATLTIGNEVIKIKKDSPIDYDFKIKREGLTLSLEKAWSIESLAKKVGLVKESEDDYWDVGQEGLNIKVNDTTKKDKKTKKDGSQGKIKVYEGQTEYNGGFKFTIENGDLNLNDDGSTTIILEEFQSYEIVKDGEKWYLSKKDDGQERIKELLGLSCEFPTGQTSSKECSLEAQKIKTIKFKEGKASLSGGTVTLTISKDSSKEEYPLGFKFSFKNTNDSDATLTIDKEVITLKKESPVEFKIKKEESSLFLEKAWTPEELIKKVGFKKDGEFWDVNESNLNVKQGTNKETGRERDSNQKGRIKIYGEQKGYNEGLKLVVEKGDINLKAKQGSTAKINILGQYETYEIKKDEDGNWYLTRKKGSQEKIKELLGFGCELPTDTTPKECTLNNENIKTTKFDGAVAGNVTVTGSPKLTTSKDSTYPMGYKFTFTSSSGNSTINLPAGSNPSSITLKKGVDIDYMIKSPTNKNDVLTLAKTWTPDKLMEEVSLKKNGSDDWWHVSDGGASIKQGENKSTSSTPSSTKNAKIRVYEGTPGYNQGYKFVVEEGNTTMDGSGSISQITKYESYEVATYEGQWYFTRKLNTSDSIREILGLPSTCQMPTDQDTSKTCELDSEKLKEVKFKDKETDSVTVSGGGSVTLKITKESSSTNLPLGYKFTFNSNNEFKIKEAGGKSTLERTGN